MKALVLANALRLLEDQHRQLISAWVSLLGNDKAIANPTNNDMYFDTIVALKKELISTEIVVHE